MNKYILKQVNEIGETIIFISDKFNELTIEDKIEALKALNDFVRNKVSELNL